MTTELPVDESCVFCRIVARRATANIRYESAQVIAFDDSRPKAPTHVLICPKGHYPTFLDTPESVLAHLNSEIKSVAAHLGFEGRGFRLVVNNGRESGQIIFHLHFHFLAGSAMRDL